MIKYSHAVVIQYVIHLRLERRRRDGKRWDKSTFPEECGVLITDYFQLGLLA